MSKCVKNNNPIWRRIHYPALAVCLGTVFMAPQQHREQGNLICVKWTILSLALICFCTLYDIARHHECPANEGKIVKSVFLVGMIEVIVCLLQSTKVMVSCNPFFAFTGSFSDQTKRNNARIVCFQKDGDAHYAKVNRTNVKTGKISYTDSTGTHEVEIDSVEGVLYYEK